MKFYQNSSTRFYWKAYPEVTVNRLTPVRGTTFYMFSFQLRHSCTFHTLASVSLHWWEVDLSLRLLQSIGSSELFNSKN